MEISAIQMKIGDIGACGLYSWQYLPYNGFYKSLGVGVGKSHQALSDLDHDFKAPPRGGHNTPEK